MGLSAPPVRVTGRCTGCGACLLTCPERAIRPAAGWAALGQGPLYVLDQCTGCGDCVEVCPADAIEET
jgi:Pyruvate/2-oxoacid:ferredoxin oxidoreductase delta subunit